MDKYLYAVSFCGHNEKGEWLLNDCTVGAPVKVQNNMQYEALRDELRKKMGWVDISIQSITLLYEESIVPEAKLAKESSIYTPKPKRIISYDK